MTAPWNNDTKDAITRAGNAYQYDYGDKDNPTFDLHFSKDKNTPFVRIKLGVWQGNDKPNEYYTVVAFDQQAEAICESLQPGDRIVVHGHLKEKQFEKRDGTLGVERTIMASDVAVSLKWSRVKVLRAERTEPKPTVVEKAAELEAPF